MVSDIRLDSGMDVEINAGNDIGLVSGHEQLEQSLGTDVMDEIQNLIGGRVDGHNVGLLEERMRQALNDDPQVGDIAYVNVEEFDRRTASISAEVGVVEDENFRVEVTG